MIAKRPRVVPSIPYVIGGLTVLLFVYAAAGSAVSKAPGKRPTPQTRTVDPAATIWLIFIDDLHLDFTATGHLKNLFKKVAAELVHEGDLFGVVSTGPSSIAVDLTSDRGELTRALGQMTGAALKPSEILQPMSATEVRYRAHVTFGTAYSVMNMLELVPNKRKAFIYISNGYYFDLGPGTSSEAGRENPFLSGGNEVTLERLRAEGAELARQATRASVTIFGIDPRGLSGPPTIEPNMNVAVWRQYWTTTRNSLQVIAEQTGGRVIQDDLDANLKRIVSAMR